MCKCVRGFRHQCGGGQKGRVLHNKDTSRRIKETKGNFPICMQTAKSIWAPLPEQSMQGYYSNECNSLSDVMHPYSAC